MNTSRGDTTLMLKSLKAALRPIIRLIVGAITYEQYNYLSRVLFVEEAERSIRLSSPKKPKNTLISILTSIDSRQFPPKNTNGSYINSEIDYQRHPFSETALLQSWHNSKRFWDKKNNRPKVIRIRGTSISLDKLVGKHFGRGVTVQSVLKRLLENNNVEMVDENRVRLLNAVYRPSLGNRETHINNGLKVLTGVADTLSRNMENPDPEARLFQRQLLSVPVSNDQIADITDRLNDLLRAQHMKAQELVENLEQDNGGEEFSYVGLGHYVFSQAG